MSSEFSREAYFVYRISSLESARADLGQWYSENGKIDKAARTVTAEDWGLRLDRAVFIADLARDPGAVWALRERFF
ncbi:MAG: hypothetical protein KAY65_16505 [Planctomycetes bacterium]|nr:hypothetical protein [Planctomycetota bacterium]